MASHIAGVGPSDRYTVNVPNFCLISTTLQLRRSSEGSSLTIVERRSSSRTRMGFHPSKQLNAVVLAMGNVDRREPVQSSEGASSLEPLITVGTLPVRSKQVCDSEHTNPLRVQRSFLSGLSTDRWWAWRSVRWPPYAPALESENQIHGGDCRTALTFDGGSVGAKMYLVFIKAEG